MPMSENAQPAGIESSLAQKQKEKAIPVECRNNNGNVNNNHHVVPVGIMILLLTLYLTTAALKRNYAPWNAVETKIEDPKSKVIPVAAAFAKVQNPSQEKLTIRERFLEHEHVCMDLAIFTKDQDGHSTLDAKTKNPAQKSRKHLRDVRREARSPHKRKRMKSTLKSNHGKKMEAPVTDSNKKEQQAKKNTTAEPIIYLFALVFIYLLLKAASDINQHYKSQAKGDKRLRRCSLQSYAQTHKQDRRASKDSQLKLPLHDPHQLKQRLMEFRSKSVDRCINPSMQCDYGAKREEILTNLRKYTSVDETQPHAHHSHMSLCDSGQLGPCSATVHSTSSISMNRRCSVPTALSYQGAKIGVMPVLPPQSSSPRRISIASSSIGIGSGGVGSGLEFLQGVSDAKFPEVKRRVRMINRH